MSWLKYELTYVFLSFFQQNKNCELFLKLSSHYYDNPAFSTSLNSIDENSIATTDKRRESFPKNRRPSLDSNGSLEKRFSDPNTAIRFSFYNRMFDVSAGSPLLSPPQKDFRKFSLPSMTSSQDLPSSSVLSPPWKSTSMANCIKTTQRSSAAPVFRWTVNDAVSDSNRIASPMESFIDEQCLHFEENFVNLDALDNFDQLNERFSRKAEDCGLIGWDNSDKVISSDTICRKCGHDILRL